MVRDSNELKHWSLKSHSFLIVYDFSFIPFPDFKLMFKILILVFFYLNLNLKLQNFNIAVTYQVCLSRHPRSQGKYGYVSGVFTRRKRGECRRCKRTLCRREHLQNAILCWNFFSGSFKRDLMKHTLAKSDQNATVRMTLYWVLFIIMGVVTENSANL